MHLLICGYRPRPHPRRTLLLPLSGRLSCSIPVAFLCIGFSLLGRMLTHTREAHSQSAFQARRRALRKVGIGLHPDRIDSDPPADITIFPSEKMRISMPEPDFAHDRERYARDFREPRSCSRHETSRQPSALGAQRGSFDAAAPGFTPAQQILG